MDSEITKRIVTVSLTAPAPMEYVMVEENTAGSASDDGGAVLNHAAINVSQQLHTGMKSLFLVHDVSFQRLLKAVELSIENNMEAMYALIFNLQYNSRQTAEL